MKRSARDYMRVWWLLVRSGLRGAMQYKANFLISTLLRATISLADFAIVAVILMRFRFVNGWDVYEVALLYGPASIAHGLYRAFANELERFEDYIISGDFDGILVRPWPSLLGLLARKTDFSRLGLVVQGMLVTGVGAAELVRRGSLQGWEAVYLALLPIFGALVLLAVSLATAALAFWIVRVDELQVFTMYAPLTASFYPLSIYPGWLKGLLLTIIPIGYTNYVPVTYLLGKGFGPWALAAPAAAAVAAILAAYSLWRVGERRYTSTGS